MSSPDIQSNYSYSPDLSLSPPNPGRQYAGRGPSAEQRAPPRLSSPHYFRDIFATDGVESSSRRPNFDLPPINYRETMDGVNRALQSANRAVQNAQEAFQSRRIQSSSSSSFVTRRHSVVDLTDSPPRSAGRNPPGDGFQDRYLARVIHPLDPSHGTPALYGEQRFDPTLLDIDQIDPASTFTGADSLAGPRRRFEMQRRAFNGGPNMSRTLFRTSHAESRRHEEEEAIRRQRIARQQWEDGQRRLQERQRLENQRQRLLLSPGTQRNTRPRNIRALSPSSSNEPIPVEAVDLTKVEDTDTLAAALSQSKQESQPPQSSTTTMKDNLSGDSDARTPLTAYKCPICMETPEFPTSTACGHLFCHKCIIDTLKWSENTRREELPPGRKITGVCPVCRKPMARIDKVTKTRTLIPLEIKALTKSEWKRRQQAANGATHETKLKGKGKGRARDESEDTINQRTTKKAKVVDLEDDNGDDLFAWENLGNLENLHEYTI